MAFKIWIAEATNVTIDICGYLFANGSGQVTVSATATEAVNTNVSIYWTWVGDLSSIVSGTTTISSGNTFGSSTVGGAYNDEGFSYFTGALLPSPGSNLPQIYSTTIGGCY
jgi:hypothetical protein